MIFLESITLKDFLSHEKTTIRIEDNSHLLIDGDSGAGKSAIVEALMWGLYGKGRSDNRSLIRHGRSIANVSIVLKNTNDDEIFGYKIIRSINKSGIHTLNVLEIRKEGKITPIKVNGLKNVQDYLEKQILHSSYLLFINSIIYPQDNVDSFVRQTATKRKDIILEMINASDYDEYYNKTKNKLNELNFKQTEYETNIRYLNDMIIEDDKSASMLGEHTSKKKELEKQLEKENKELEELQKKLNDINILKIRLDEKSNLLTDMQRKEKTMTEEIDRLTKIQGLPLHDIKELENELKTLKISENKANEWRDKSYKLLQDKPVDLDFDGKIKEINKQMINEMSDNDNIDICPITHEKCPLILDKINVRVKLLQEQLSKVTLDKKEYLKNENIYLEGVKKLGNSPVIDKDRINEVEIILVREGNNKHTVEDIKKLKIDLSTITGEISNLKNIITEGLVSIKDFPIIQNEISKKQSDIYVIDSSVNENLKMLTLSEDASKRIKVNIEKIGKEKENNKELLKHIEALKLLKDAFSPNGIRAIIIDYIIPRLEEKINGILSKLSDFRIRLDTQKEGIGDDILLEGLFIDIFNESGECFNYESYSGGEKVKISMAINEGLAEISNIGFRVLDELFIGLDDESTKKFVEVMLIMQERFSQLLCISHLRNIKDTFHKQIKIIKENGVSRIIN